MASSMKPFFILFLLPLFFSTQTQARESQFFNKVSSSTTSPAAATTDTTATTTEQPLLNANQPQEPTFLPENEDSYGLYGHESGQLTPSATTSTDTNPFSSLPSAVDQYSKEPAHKYLPKNYNPVAYVTVPEDGTDSTPFSDNAFTGNLNSESNNEEVPYYAADKQPQGYATDVSQYRSYDVAGDNHAGSTTSSLYSNDNNYRFGSSFNSEPRGVSGGQNYMYNGAGETANIRPQGMSDTRFLENGKYYYDINSGTYNGNHPYETLKAVRARNEYSGFSTYGNGETAVNYGDQNRYEFPEEESWP